MIAITGHVEHAGGAGPWGQVMLRTLDRLADQTNLTGLARRLGYDVSTFRKSVCLPGRSPRIDDIARRRNRFDDETLRELAQHVLGDRGIATMIDQTELPDRQHARVVLERTVKATRKFGALLEDVYARCADGVICQGDAAAIASQAAQIRQDLDALQAIAQRSALRRSSTNQ